MRYFWAILSLLMLLPLLAFGQAYPPLSITPEPIAPGDVLYPIVFAQAPRFIPSGNPQKPLIGSRWAEFGHPVAVNPGTHLMLRNVDGSLELLVNGGAGAVQDLCVSFDGTTVFYTLFHTASAEPNKDGADIYKIHVPSRQITRLTTQTWATNQGETPGTGVYNMHPCPMPGGKVVFVSNRHGYLPPVKSYPTQVTQLFVMDEHGDNVEPIGHLNLGSALHPTVLTDGRILFSTLENMALRNNILWGIWSIWQDGSVWAPIVSAFAGPSAPPGFHFQTQLSDGRILVEKYYNQNQKGFGTFYTIPQFPAVGQVAFGPGNYTVPENTLTGFIDKFPDQMPYTPTGMWPLTTFTRRGDDRPGLPMIADDPRSLRVGKVTHPSGAPGNKLLLVWSPGLIGGSSGTVSDDMDQTPINSGIYLANTWEHISDPGKHLKTVLSDPASNLQWPRALVPYQQIYGVEAPAVLVAPQEMTATLPEGTPYGLVGTSSLYKRESAPLGMVTAPSVTSVTPPGLEFNTNQGPKWNWMAQGADAGKYGNDEIHAIRLVTFEPNQFTKTPSVLLLGEKFYPEYWNHGSERLRILGEVPVRDGKPVGVLDPDGNPDTSFLAKIPADVAFTFQLLDTHGLVLTTAQTWHQVRPGEKRNNCGGCHAHNQQPTNEKDTFSEDPAYIISTLEQNRLIEFTRDIKPIFDRACVRCHNLAMNKPGGLVLDDTSVVRNLPGTYARLADSRGTNEPLRLEKSGANAWILRQGENGQKASHWVWKYQSRRSLLLWRLFDQRLDGYTNATIPGGFWPPNDPRRQQIELGAGQVMPPPEWPLYDGDIDWAPPAGVPSHKEMLSDDERRTIAAWIDTGATYCATERACQDSMPPTVRVTSPQAGKNEGWARILLGMVDVGSGLNLASLEVVADVAIDGVAAGTNLASRFTALTGGRWEWVFSQPMPLLPRAVLVVRVKDKIGNGREVRRVFHVEGTTPPPVTHAENQWTIGTTTAQCVTDGPQAVPLIAQIDACLMP